MQTKPRAKSVITWAVQSPDVQVCKVVGCPDIVIDRRRIHADNRERFEWHGIRQRVQDAAALSRNTADGKAAPPEAKHAAMAKVAEHYLSGAEAWELARVAPQPGLDRMALAAVAEATGKTPDEVRAIVAAGAAKRTMTPNDYLTQLTTADRVKVILDRMRAEVTTVDADAELDAMMAAAPEDEDEDEDQPADDEAPV